jgi:hypothetical protein
MLVEGLMDISELITNASVGSRYVCDLYVNLHNVSRFLLVCEKEAFPSRCRPTEWRPIAYGVQPPERCKPWLKAEHFTQIWLEDRVDPEDLVYRDALSSVSRQSSDLFSN